MIPGFRFAQSGLRVYESKWRAQPFSLTGVAHPVDDTPVRCDDPLPHAGAISAVGVSAIGTGARIGVRTAIVSIWTAIAPIRAATGPIAPPGGGTVGAPGTVRRVAVAIAAVPGITPAVAHFATERGLGRRRDSRNERCHAGGSEQQFSHG